MRKELILTSLSAFSLFTLSAQSLDNMALSIGRNNKAYNASVALNKAEQKTLLSEANLSDPEVDVSHVWGANGIGNKFDFTISQSFDWPGLYKAKRNAANADLQVMEYEELNNLSDLIFEIKQTMIAAITAHNKMSLYRDALTELDSLSLIVEKNVQKKEVSVLDGNKLKIERIALNRKYKQSVTDYNLAYNQLCEMNGGKSCEEFFGHISEFSCSESLKPLNDYIEESNLYNPQQLLMEASVKAAQAKTKVSKMNSYPGFSVGYNYQKEMGDQFNGVTFSMSLPVFSNRNKSAAAKLNEQAVILASEQRENAEQTRINASYVKAESLLSEITEYSAILDSEDNLLTLRKAFEARYISLLDYLNELIYFTDAKVQYIDLRHDLRVEIASLDRFNWLREQ